MSIFALYLLRRIFKNTHPTREIFTRRQSRHRKIRRRNYGGKRLWKFLLAIGSQDPRKLREWNYREK